MNTNPTSFMVEIVYATKQQQDIISYQAHPGDTIQQVIEQSGILNKYPEIDLKHHAVGIFGKKKSLETEVHAADRIEIYRALIIDPKKARVLRAKS